MAEGGHEKSVDIPKEGSDCDDDEHLTFYQEFRDFLNISSSCKGNGARVLTSPDIDGIIEYMMTRDCKNIITMAGAGISTSAGVPDFRSPGTGIYSSLEKYKLPHPSSVFEIDYFKKNPEPFFTLVRNLFPAKLIPTPSHFFIRLLHEKGMLLRHYTQNIDSMERMAGIPDSKIVEAHGSFHTGHCLKCNKEYTQSWLKEQIFKTTIPHCPVKGCDGVVKPDVIFFGENLPRKFFEYSGQDFSKCDLLIILGTSLTVLPFASLMSKVRKSTPRLYINLDNKGSSTGMLSSLFGSDTGFRHGKSDNFRDVFWKGTCDAGCTYLAKSMGWESELKALSSKLAGSSSSLNLQRHNLASTSVQDVRRGDNHIRH